MPVHDLHTNMFGGCGGGLEGVQNVRVLTSVDPSNSETVCQIAFENISKNVSVTESATRFWRGKPTPGRNARKACQFYFFRKCGHGLHTLLNSLDFQLKSFFIPNALAPILVKEKRNKVVAFF